MHCWIERFWDLSTPMARIRGFRRPTDDSRIPLRCIRATSRTHIPRTLALRRANRRMRRADQGLRCLSPQGEFAKHPARRVRRAGIAAVDAMAGRASLLTFLRAQESKSPAGARSGRRMMAQATMPRNHCNRDLADSVQAVRGSGIDRRPESALSADQPMIPGFRFAASGLVYCGWHGFSDLAKVLPMPVFAIGGLSCERMRAARGACAHGIAAIRGSWG